MLVFLAALLPGASALAAQSSSHPAPRCYTVHYRDADSVAFAARVTLHLPSNKFGNLESRGFPGSTLWLPYLSRWTQMAADTVLLQFAMPDITVYYTLWRMDTGFAGEMSFDEGDVPSPFPPLPVRLVPVSC